MKNLKIINNIQTVLSNDLLNNYWKNKIKKEKHHKTAGHCYAASESLYHLIGGKNSGYTPHVGKNKNNETHWWLQDKNGNILDPTFEQFYFKNENPPYDNGRGTGFLTKKPSKRASIIIEKIDKKTRDI
jgi:hypothetical protein